MQKDKKEVKKNIADACEKACEKENWEEVKKAEDANIFEAFKKAAENIEAENAAAIANDPNLEVVNGQLQRKPEDQCVAAPDGVEMGVEIENSDLSKRLEELFSLAKKNVDFKDDLDVVATGTDIDLDQYTTVELPNGMTVKVHKDSHKSNKEDMARLIEAAGGEMDCSDEDDEGNLIDHSIVAEEEVKSEYTPGMLRNKSMVKNAAAEDAQKRLNSKVSEEEAARRVTIPREKHNEDLPLDNKINWEDVLVKLDNASAKTVTEIDNGAPVQKKNIHSNEKIWEALTLLGQAAIEKRTLEGKPPAPKGTIEKIKSLREQISDLQHKLAQAQKDEIRAIQDSFTIDWSCFADKMFQSKVNKICEKKMTKVAGPHDLIITIPEGMVVPNSVNQSVPEKLERILSADSLDAYRMEESLNYQKRLKERDKNVLKIKQQKEERSQSLAKTEKEKALTLDIIPIMPIENPNLVRRSIRSVRRWWKLFMYWVRM